MEQRRWHPRVDIATIVIGAVVLAACAAAARGELTEFETSIFEAANELPQSLYPFVWPLMQYGTFVTIPILAVIAFMFRRFRFGLAMLLAVSVST